MNNTLLAAAALGLALTACSPVSPRAPQTAPAQTQPQSAAERNKANALAFYELAFNQHDLQRAVRQYVGKEYLQHNPMVADGGQAFIDAFAPFLKQNPQSRASVKRVIADGDLVALHVHSQLSPDDAGEAVVDIFRSDNDGKIVEHWDVIQPVPKEKTASGRSMF
ncbi:nuclear transport factor 2 family protein [Kingella oralis]|nr:nuclear transport factor 2 family protein [Kingella oralis]QMT42491.1 nuclear transport factor 2 family protein [Kingella oralis]